MHVWLIFQNSITYLLYHAVDLQKHKCYNVVAYKCGAHGKYRCTEFNKIEMLKNSLIDDTAKGKTKC